MKKVLALTLVLVLALSMSTVAFAATSAVGEKVNYEDWGAKAFYFADTSDLTTPVSGDIDLDLEAGPADSDGDPADVYSINTGVFIVDDRGAAATTATTLGKAGDYKNVKINTSFSKGSMIAKDAEVDAAGQIVLKFAKNVMSVKDIDFKITITANIGGRSMNSGSVTFAGTYYVYEQSTDNDWFDFTQGDTFLKTDSYIRNMEFELGEGVSVFGRALKNVAYKGKADIDPSEADEALMFEHPEIVTVYHLSEINIKNVAEYVTLNNEGADLLVYDGDFNLLGKANEKLAYSDTYYLALSELDIDADEPDDFGDDDEEYEPGDIGGNSSTGGDDLYPENPHDNPGTGK